MLDKTYRPSEVEAKHYGLWESAGDFAAGRRPGAETYCIVIPPPNVTGSLHMGHALNSTLQDVLIRLARMRGKDTLWQPGLDHAGIATQLVVERQREAQGRGRRAHTPAAAVAPGRVAVSSQAITGPVSMPSSICIRHTPVRSSPWTIAHWIGPAPRQRGRIEACTLTQPVRGESSTARGRIRP